MAVIFDQKLNKKIYKYCLVVAKQYGKVGDLATQLAKEVRQKVLIIIFQKKDYWDKKMNDNLLFITCKRQMYSHIISHNTKKEQQFLDSHQILLGKNDTDLNLEIIDITTDIDYIEAKEKDDERYNILLKRIENKLNSKELNNEDKQIFILYFLENRKQKEIAKLLKIPISKLPKIVKKIKIAMRYDFEFENKKIKIIEI